MGRAQRSPSPGAWGAPEVREAVDAVPTPARATSSPTLQDPAVKGAAQERARLEQELEIDRRFFADPPEDYVRCPLCNVVYAVQSSRPTTPSDIASIVTSAPPMIPASYSWDLPRGSNLSLEEATRHLHRSRFRCAQCDMDFCRCGVSPYHWGWSCDGWQKEQQFRAQASPAGRCRWCCEPATGSNCGSEKGLELKRFPPSLSCTEKERRSCGRRHMDCGHWCGGIRAEEPCLPCLHPDCRRKAGRNSAPIPTPPWCAAYSQGQATGSSAPPPTPASASSQALKLPEADDWCSICWTEPLSAAPAIRLGCGHVVHHHCAEALVKKGNTGGRRLTFKSIRCPLCQAIIQHPSLNQLIAPQHSMYQKVRRKALQRWVVENRRPALRPSDPGDEDRVAQLAMSKMMFFECCQCNEPYYGGEVECGGQMEDEQDDLDDDVQAALAMELVCRGCASKGQLQCPEHGVEFLGWKCRYCCEREAHYFCFGTTHFCFSCHDLWQTGVEQRRKLQAGKPCLGKDRCIFRGRHPPGCRNGRDEYALGCTICAQDAESGVLVNQDKKSTRRFSRHCSLM